MPADRETFARAAASGTAVGLAQLATYGLNFVLGILVAARFGATRVTDAYFMASSTAELLAKLLLGGALTSVLLPIFVGRVGAGDPDRAWRLFCRLFSLAVVAFLLLGGVLELTARPLVAFLAPGFAGETHALTVVLLRLILPAYLLSFLSDVAVVPLHAHRRFGIPAISRAVVPLLTIQALLAFAGRIGVLTLAIGTLLGTSVQLLLLFAALRRSGHRFRFTLSLGDPDVRSVFALTLPFVFSILAAHGAGIVYRVLVSHEPEGSLASLKFGEKIFNVTNTLFLTTVTQISFPAMARAAAGSPGEARDRFRTAARFLAFIGIPLTIGVLLLREPLVRLLYERGAFTPEATAATAAIVPFFVLGLLGNGWSSLLGHLALALKATRLSVGVNIVLQTIAAGLFLLLTPPLGIAGLALVSGLGPFLLTGLYLFTLRRKVPRLPSALVDRGTPSLLLAGGACGTAVLALTMFFRQLPPSTVHDAALLLTAGATGTLVYLAVTWLLRVPEVGMLSTFTRTALRKVIS